MTDNDKYEGDCTRIRKANELLLTEFESSLELAGLSAKTIENHVLNVGFYIDDYLLYSEAVEAKDGAGAIDDFLGYWFIKKAMWASRTSVKSNAASLKKFYTFMHQKGLLTDDDLKELKETVKEGMPEWLATLDRYDNPIIGDVW